MAQRASGLWFERLLFLLALVSIWPSLIGWTHPLWKVLMYVMLGVMGVLLVVNIRRLWRMGHSGPGPGHCD